jgi:hypothetical protein
VANRRDGRCFDAADAEVLPKPPVLPVSTDKALAFLARRLEHLGC